MRHLLLAATLCLTLTACSDSSRGDRAGGGTPRVTITVFAAASLKDTFTEIRRQFKAEHLDIAVEFSFAGSSDLVAQIQQGAPADVFASADMRTMDTAAAAGVLDGDPRSFATNTLEIATPPDNPARVASVYDLGDPRIRTVVCAPQVPCGAAAVGVQKAAGIDIPAVSEEQSVTDVLGKVMAGEADAGLVYVTDVRAAGDQVAGIQLPASARVVNTYPIAALRRSSHKAAARLFASFAAGPRGRAVLTAAGFGAP
ncbi:molybdate ABC transporter substrate-binding protein [Aeromicrobium sp.]|uniref:molybdate ABC transporter substrate-binding protein n=1 Tax=Aeromicrobium sp. TaxID=1871063 RepID=UPI003C680E86